METLTMEEVFIVTWGGAILAGVLIGLSIWQIAEKYSSDSASPGKE